MSPLPLPLHTPELLLLLLLLLLLFVDFVLTLLRRREATARAAALLLLFKILDVMITFFWRQIQTDLRGEVVVLVDAAVAAAAAVCGDHLAVHDSRGGRE